MMVSESWYDDIMTRLAAQMRFERSQPVGVVESVFPDGTATIRLGGVPVQGSSLAIVEITGTLPPCPETLDNANSAILGPEVLRFTTSQGFTITRTLRENRAENVPGYPTHIDLIGAVGSEYKAIASFPPAPPGSLCEVCLDGAACLLMPAPWGGDMGVCMACTVQPAEGV